MYIVATFSIIWKLKFTHKLLPVKISSKYMQLGVWDLVLFVSSYRNNGAIGIQNWASMSNIKTFLRRNLIQKGHAKGAKEKTRGRQWGLKAWATCIAGVARSPGNQLIIPTNFTFLKSKLNKQIMYSFSPTSLSTCAPARAN